MSDLLACGRENSGQFWSVLVSSGQFWTDGEYGDVKG